MAVKIELPNHPDYDASLEEWKKIDDFLDGSKMRVCTSTYIRPYITESSNTDKAGIAHAERVGRSYNTNLVRPFAEIHLAHLSQKITIEGAEGGDLQLIRDDVDGYGHSVEAAVRDWAWYYMAHGKVGIGVESPRAENILSKADANNAGLRSYQNLYQATHIKRWERFKSGPMRGQLSEVLVCEEPEMIGDKYMQMAMRWFLPAQGAKCQWQRLAAGELKKPVVYGEATQYTERKKDEYEIVSSGEIDLDHIPFVIIGCGLDDSILRANVDYNLAHLNRLSVLSNVLFNQGFQRTLIAGEKVDDEAFKNASESIVWVVEGINVAVTSIPAGDAEALFREVSKLELLCLRTGLMQTYQLLDDTRAVQSAESKAFDSKARAAEYDRILDLITDGLTHVMKLHAEFEGQSPDAIEVEISRDYGLEDPQKTVLGKQLAASIAQNLGATEVLRELLKIELAAQRLTLEPGEDAEEKMQRLFRYIDTLGGPELAAPPSFSQFMANRPSVGESWPQ